MTGTLAAEQVDPPASSWIGNNSGITQTREVVIKNQQDWEKLWQEIHQTREPSPPVPAVNFSKNMIIGYFLGEKPSGGYSVSVQSCRQTQDEVVVIISQKSPQPDEMVSQVITTAYTLELVPKSDKKVRFQLEPVK